jgi:hypothetical protein
LRCGGPRLGARDLLDEAHVARAEDRKRGSGPEGRSSHGTALCSSMLTRRKTPLPSRAARAGEEAPGRTALRARPVMQAIRALGADACLHPAASRPERCGDAPFTPPPPHPPPPFPPASRRMSPPASNRR